MTTIPVLAEFGSFSPEQRAEMQAEVDSQLAVERAWIDPSRVVADATSLCDRISAYEVVTPCLAIDHFGVVSPIRDRRPSRSDPVEVQSYPYVTSGTYGFMLNLMASLYDAVMEERVAFAVDDIAFSVTSLLRTVGYQKHIAGNGQLAVMPEESKWSSHNEGRAFDVDHGGGYVFKNGLWITANPHGNFELWQPIRRVMRGVLADVLQTMEDHNAIDEVPAGWGTYHIAVKPQTDTINT